jgi:polar amino acid transport system substrate-binding protein
MKPLSTSPAIGALALLLAGSLAGSLPALAQDAGHPDDQPLTGAAEVGFAPFLMAKADGTIEGFNYDMNTELAERLGRPGLEIVEVPWANIFAGLYAGRYEYIAAPVTITEARAAEMLFAEPYMDVGLGFITLSDSPLASMDELSGKTVSVVSGSVQDDWMQANAAEYGIDVARFDATPDALQALRIGRTAAHMSTDIAGRWLVQEQPVFAIDVTLPAYGQFGLAFRPDDVAFRDSVEQQLECMKSDGTLPAIYEKWFGVAPAADSASATVYPGVGAPGWPGHDATVTAPAC